VAERPKTIERAVLLAAGRGTRMGTITEEIPKPLLPVHGKPLMERIMDRLAEAGIRRFLVVVGFQGELIERYFAEWRLPVEFRVQEPVNGTGSAAILAKEFAGQEPFLLSFGDCLCSAAEYVRCLALLEDNPATAAVLAAKDIADPWLGAAIYEQDGRVTRIIEKPPKGTSTTRWGSAGFYGFRPVLFEYLERLTPSVRKEYEITSAFEMMLADGLELRISPVEGEWRDVGRPEDLAAVNE
jgi:UDP-N-acetylglucosamine diphosphorylase / glucose-1-phosphate thymidylyltransferase / UDP-N-acetylgalactosamine diphosphorylase / glucosamine-1-phosphate N-acetyltransferase / galactosamine-1-phosphate N-acetyltransferase